MTGPLKGGRRKRRPGQRLALVALLLAPLAVVAALYLNHSRESTVPSGPSASALATDPGTALTPEPGGSLEPRSPAPIRLNGVDAFRLKFKKPPRAALVFDVGNGNALYRLHPRRTLPMASLTKIMTALAVVQGSQPGERVKITKAALHYSGSGVGILPKGKTVRLETLLNGLLIVSGNDAAIALADHVSGDERRFVRLMNEKARLWGLSCTHFASSHGLEPGNRSCPADLAVLARLAMREPRITRIVRRPEVALPFPIKGGKLYLYGHNPLIRAHYPGAIGLKTGYTDEAGRCFVGIARRGDKTLGVVLLNSPNPVKHAAKLLDLGFKYG
jgi:serine-type D-Ala-D-Ala carboxypeptidase (penicillin-binding protein 5/6)